LDIYTGEDEDERGGGKVQEGGFTQVSTTVLNVPLLGKQVVG
jgi:hypothetical protein